MKVIMKILAKTQENFIYVLLLLSIIIFILSLVGMQIYGGNFNAKAIILR